MKHLAALLVGGVAAVTVGAGALVVSHPEAQMEFMTDYVMKNLRDYHWSALKMEDPVTPALTEALGEEHPQSVEAFYTFMKDSASQMTWEIRSADPETMTSEVEVTYMDGVRFLEEYTAALSGHIMDALEEGSLELENVMNILEFMPDEENQTLIVRAAERGSPMPTQSTTLTVQFTRQYGLCLPQGTSEEVQDVVSSGLFNSMAGVTDMVAKQLLPRIIDKAFRSIQRFDEGELEALTGSPLSELMGMEEDSPLYPPFIRYLRSCAGKMTYTVGEYRQDEGTISVDCSFLDSKNVIQQYLQGAAGYIFTHLTHPMLTDEVNAQLLEDAIAASEEERVEKTVTITFDPEDYSSFTISDEIRDVVSANLNSEITGMTEGLAQLADTITGGGWKQMLGGLMSSLWNASP